MKTIIITAILLAIILTACTEDTIRYKQKQCEQFRNETCGYQHCMWQKVLSSSHGELTYTKAREQYVTCLLIDQYSQKIEQ